MSIHGHKPSPKHSSYTPPSFQQVEYGSQPWEQHAVWQVEEDGEEVASFMVNLIPLLLGVWKAKR